MDHVFQISDKDKKNAPLTGVLYEPEKTLADLDNALLAVMVHGFPGDKNAHHNFFEFIQESLNNYGIPGLRFDFRGCGQSPGRSQDFSLSTAAQDLKTIMHWANEQNYKKIILIGEGLGGWLSLAGMTENTKMIVLFWPVIDPSLYAKHNFPVKDTSVLEDNANFINFEGLNVGARLVKELQNTTIPVVPELRIPVMIQHGVEDEMVAIEHLDIIKHKIVAPRLDLTSYQDGTHGLPDPKHRKMIRYHLDQFLKRYI